MKVLRDQDRGAAQCEGLNRGDENVERAHAARIGDIVRGGYRSPVGIESSAARSGAASEVVMPSSVSRLSMRSRRRVGAERSVEPKSARDQLRDGRNALFCA
jgi:hypothetical protein